MNGVSDYLYGEAQKAATRDERDLWSLTLALVAAVRGGAPVPFQEACFKAFGGTLEAYQAYRNKEKWLAKREFFAALPDYDPVEAEHAERAQLQKNHYQKQARTDGLDDARHPRVVAIRASRQDPDLQVRDLLPGARRETPKRRDSRARRASS